MSAALIIALVLALNVLARTAVYVFVVVVAVLTKDDGRRKAALAVLRIPVAPFSAKILGLLAINHGDTTAAHSESSTTGE